MGYGGDMPQQKVKTMYLDNIDKQLNRLKVRKIKIHNESVVFKKSFGKVNKINKKKPKKKKRKERTVIRSYKTYMQSTLWKKRKNLYWQKYKKICQACGNKHFVTLHHKIYTGEYGNEPDKDVVALCKRCHSEFHKHYGCSKNMRVETDEFVKHMKSIKTGLQELYELDN